jgi:aldehyde:ferredoxin oxidoreductase
LIGGYTSRIIKIDLSNRKIELQEFDAETIRKYIGGSGFGARVLYDETDHNTDPLGPDNLLIFLTGPLTGSAVPTSGRHSVISKSPLTLTWGEAEVGGSWGWKLKRAGYDGIIFVGKSENPIIVLINKEDVSIKDGKYLWGMDTYATDASLKETFGKKAGIACIGHAGENLVKMATIMNDGPHGRAAGRGGLGAVMGSKNLKAIVVIGSQSPKVANSIKLKNSVRKMIPIIKEKTEALHKYGTAGGILFAEEIGDLPIKNWSLGKWEKGASKISGQAMSSSILVGRYFCRSCPIGCGRIVETTTINGHVKGGGPELESLAALGSLCLIDDLKTIAFCNELCNRLGLDTISTGSVIAFAMEANEKGMLPKDLCKGIDLYWGNKTAMIELIKRIASRKGLGNILAEGVKKASEELGPFTKEFALEVKGLEPSMHDPRAYSSLAVQYATSPNGASHWAGTYLVEGRITYPELGYPSILDRFESKGKGVLTAKLQDCVTMLNSLRLCRFLMRIPISVMIEWFNDVTGWEMDLKEFMKTGERISNLKRMYNVRCGMSRKDDTLPLRLTTQKKGGGTRDFLPNLGEMLSEYYDYRGWNEDGLPTAETLINLGLEDEIKDLPYTNIYPKVAASDPD